MNPFIDLVQDPVTTLTILGWFMLLITLLFVTAAICYRNLLTISHQWHADRPHQWKYVPPVSFILRVAAVPAILWLDLWVIAAILWLVT